MNLNFETYNINYSRRAVGEVYGQYSWENRRSDVYKLIGSDKSIVFLQEILTKNMGDVETSLSDYQWHFEPTNARNGVCCNGIGINKAFMPGVEQKKFAYNFNQFDKTAEKVMGVTLGNICLLNAHFPMEESGRMAMAENFDRCLPSDKEYRLIIAGDFNAFPDCKGPEQIETIRKVTGTVRISDYALSESTGEIATRSFEAYPYDEVPEEALKLIGKLDHIYLKGFKVVEGTTPLVLDARKVAGKDFSPSDLYPIIITLS